MTGSPPSRRQGGQSRPPDPPRKGPTTGRRCPRLSAACFFAGSEGASGAPCGDSRAPLPGRSAAS